MPIDLDAYERVGDLAKPFEVTAKDARRQDGRQRLRHSMRCDVAPLMFEQYRAGAPCPGCGLPYVDSEPFDFKGTRTSVVRARAKAYNALQDLVVTAPAALREQLAGLYKDRLIHACEQLPEPETLTTPTDAVTVAIKSLAARCR